MTTPSVPMPPTEPKRDRYGRYLITQPNGKPVSYTRATTIAGTDIDTYNLERWRERQLTHGLAQREDLITSAQAHHPHNDRGIYEQIIENAYKAAAGDAGANTGTALHRMTEDIDTGRKTIKQIPAHWRPTLELYTHTLETKGIVVDPEHIEQVVIDDTHQIAGTVDRIVTLPDGRRCVADLKTGKDLEYGGHSIGVQLAIYANHTHTYSYDTDTRGPRIDVDTDHAVIIHLPSEGPEHGTCTPYLIDIRDGYGAMLHALETRDIRKASKGWLTIYQPLNGGTGGATAEPDWLRDRISRLAGNPQAITLLRALWPDTIPQPLPDELTPDQTTALAKALDTVEAQHCIPFPATRPGVTR